MVAVFGKNHFRTFKWFEIKHHLSFNILNLFLGSVLPPYLTLSVRVSRCPDYYYYYVNA